MHSESLFLHRSPNRLLPFVAYGSCTYKTGIVYNHLGLGLVWELF